MTKLLLLGLAGALGTVARVGLSAAVERRFGSYFPFGTLSVNLAGCALFGLIWAVASARGGSALDLRFYALAGFLGAFTTFSSLIFDVAALAAAGRPLVAMGNLVLQNVLGLACLALGSAAGRAL